MDLLWSQAAELALQHSPQSVVGPEGFGNYLSDVSFQDYKLYDGGLVPDAWVLHRGIPAEWPKVIRDLLIEGEFKILGGNEVFTIVKAAPAERYSLPDDAGNDEKSFWNVCLTLNEIQEAPADEHTVAAVDKYQIDKIVRSLVDVQGWETDTQPNTSSAGELLRDMRIMRSNIKTLAWRLEQLDSPPPLQVDQLLSVAQALALSRDSFAISSRLCKSTDIYSDWHRLLSKSLRSSNYKLRKIWEWTFTIKALHDLGKLGPGCSGLGFGCGTEPLASCFANFVDHLLITDAPPEIIHGKGWSDTNQHTASLEQAKYEWLAPREKMDKAMGFEFVDMNAVPSHLHGAFDFVWSSCALEHLGSKQHGLNFIVDSSKCLKPGGISIHTTEFDLSASSTVDNWETVLFNELDFSEKLTSLFLEALASDPTNRFELIGLDCSRGSAFIDGYVDIPPYSYHWDLNRSFPSEHEGGPDQTLEFTARESIYPYPQLNLSVDGIPCTSIALVIRRNF
jgi:SAM-dependent methyltransferase